MSVYLFFEGSTEETVIKRLFSDRKPKPISTRGKGGLNGTLISTLAPLVSTQPIRCLVLRDLDAHEGETPARLTQSLGDALNRMLAQRYVRLYAAVAKLHTSPAVFAQKALSHASDEQIQARFAALIAAMTFLEGA